MQVVAPKTIKSLNDLEGKTVSVDLPNGGTFVTALTVSSGSGSRRTSSISSRDRNGKIEERATSTPSSWLAVSRTCLSPPFNNDGRFHLAAVDYSKPLQSDYLPATLTSKDYPNLIPEGETVDTIAVPSVLAAYNWAPNTERSRKLALFVDAFFTKFAALQNPPFHPKWKEVSLPAPLAGWNRLPLAQQWLDKHGVEPVKRQRLRHSCKRTQPPLTSSRRPTRKHCSGNFRPGRRRGTRGHRWGSQVDSKKVRDQDRASQSATQAAPPRHPPR